MKNKYLGEYHHKNLPKLYSLADGNQQSQVW